MNQENNHQELKPSNGNGNAVQAAPAEPSVSFRPNVDIVSTQDEIVIYADLPGAEADAIDVRFERGVIELKARVASRASRGANQLEEYRVGDFQRSFRLPEEFSGSKTTAEYQNGVLCLRVPKAAEARAHRIEVQAGNG